MGFGVWGLGFGVWGLGFGVWGLGFGVWGLGFGVWGLGLAQRDLMKERLSMGKLHRWNVTKETSSDSVSLAVTELHGKFPGRWKVSKEMQTSQGEAEIESVLDGNFTLLKETYQGEKETFFVDSSLGKQQDQALEGMLPCEKH